MQTYREKTRIAAAAYNEGYNHKTSEVVNSLAEADSERMSGAAVNNLMGHNGPSCASLTNQQSND